MSTEIDDVVYDADFQIFRLKTVDSTQLYARKLIAFSEVEREFVVIADAQVDGIGTGSNSWIGKNGNLFMTVAFRLDPSMSTDSIPQFSYIGAISVGEAIAQECALEHIRLSYKWVNDILLNYKKCCGILCEIYRNQFLLVGIGINIKHFPNLVELHEQCNMPYKATSIENEGLQVNKIQLEKRILYELRKMYKLWKEHGFTPIKKLWMQRAEYLGKDVTWRNNNNTTKIGKFLGINMAGEMLLQVEENHKRTVIKLRTGSIRVLA
ncbi:Bifunctional ligase/repressor BirA [Candidatus Fokinia solitaria]|uniref:Bifunctional ligase/repressor BirA n=1 Tax=Candidatus Fokinia solitaria TaxID=1802984 RepID=A0A2U8BRM4_9RICK|nr:biotin--[acetyl-CoA-carboxylase] ligase [Candidatus Fokinia solitaria]AWD32991.1 Bifunctional ligase/repressor BirA [Candidatus Fokinia solitaria]